ncbi:MAG: cytochrome c oxidase subunit 3 [Chitinophagaceae bacterium]|nr:cytochrome c oxidase subunit 3 [Chitinophagaceae bacterium]
MDIVSNQQKQKMHPHKFTLWVAIGSLVMMFAGLTSAFIVKSNQVNWKPVTLPKVFWISTIVILLSSLAVQLALRSFKNREMNKYRMLIGATVFARFGIHSVPVDGVSEFMGAAGNIQGAGAGQFLYVIFSLHALHVIGGIVALMVMLIKAFFGKIKLYSSVPVEVAATYWHFVDFLWIYLLVFFLVIGGN